MATSAAVRNQRRQCSGVAAHAKATAEPCPKCGGSFVLWYRGAGETFRLGYECRGRQGDRRSGCGLWQPYSDAQMAEARKFSEMIGRGEDPIYKQG